MAGAARLVAGILVAVFFCLPLLVAGLIFLLLFRDFSWVLSQNADCVIGFLDDRDLGQNPGFELSLLLVVGSLLDIVDLEPLVVEQVLSCRPRVVIGVQATLQNVEVLPSNLLVVDVVGASLDPPVEVVVSLASKGEAAIQEGVE